MTSQVQSVDVSQVIDRSPVGRFQIGIFVLCGMCLIMDGFDVQALGYLAPALIKDWQLAPAEMGPVLSAALFGILVGSFVFSTIADRIGRRPVLIFATLFFAVVTLLTARAQTIDQLRLLRFIAGVGLGGIMPNAVALVGEYTPQRLRVLTILVVTNGFNVGAVAGGFLSAWIVPRLRLALRVLRRRRDTVGRWIPDAVRAAGIAAIPGPAPRGCGQNRGLRAAHR